jgi:oxygen-independent coproporphyrinogen-3 oxidase
MSLGLYISVPFCRTKCSYCNFASDVFSRAMFQRYLDRLCADMAHASETAETLGGRFERSVNSVYMGGGTPTVLDVTQLQRLFVTIAQHFELSADAEITVECAPGTLTPPKVAALAGRGVNRVSLGVQSFVDQEARAVGRLHTRAVVLEDIARLRANGITNINIDLIAGLPHQTAESWEVSLSEVIATGAPHVSVYMLEIDEDSRLGRELIAGGTKYHAHFAPDEDLTADLYETACARLAAAGIAQYEISNFARERFESRHNLKYWTRQPYFGFGVDAHSMLHGDGYGLSHGAPQSVRFATADSFEAFLAGASLQPSRISQQSALEEAFFLGLRLARGVDLKQVAAEFGDDAIETCSATMADLADLGLLLRDGDSIHLTARGRLLSNEVFERFIAEPARMTAEETGV